MSKKVFVLLLNLFFCCTFINAQKSELQQRAESEAEAGKFISARYCYVRAFEDYANRVRAAASGDGGNGGGSNAGGTGGTGGTGSSSAGNAQNLRSAPSYQSQKKGVHYAYKTSEGVFYEFQPGGFATGGYTGDWHSSDGKIAVLHQKELVLNENDTKNFLEGTHILREISSSLQGSLYNRIGNIGLNSLIPTDKEELEQNVHIEASFPNVNSKKEIEEAFNDLVNLAAQRAMRNN